VKDCAGRAEVVVTVVVVFLVGFLDVALFAPRKKTSTLLVLDVEIRLRILVELADGAHADHGNPHLIPEIRVTKYRRASRLVAAICELRWSGG
jgi:hypothetical protein